MILVIILIVFSVANPGRLTRRPGPMPDFESIIADNLEYLKHDAFDKAIALLRLHQDHFSGESRAQIEYCLAENYFFASKILNARDSYMNMVRRHPASVQANNALERLYQIEGMRADTAAMKRIMYALCLLETGRLDAGRDSLRQLVRSKIGDYACYFLADAYQRLGDLPMALAALLMLDEQFPESRITGLPVLRAELLIATGDHEKARIVIEDFLVKDPVSIFAVKARQLMKRLNH